MAEVALGRLVGRVPAAVRAQAGEQLVFTGGRLAACVGNLVIAVVMARMLEPTALALRAALLAQFLLLQLFSESISAGRALAPECSRSTRLRVRRIGITAGAILALGAVPVLGLVGLPVLTLVSLAATAPVAALQGGAR